MRILAFDTSTSWCSVAVGDEHGFAQREEPIGNAHSERLLPIVHDLLAQCGLAKTQLDAIVFGAGPGSFTGVRIACSVAQGLALGLDRPALAVGTLEALAQEARRHIASDHVIACTDARMGEVYVAAYARDGERWREARAPAVIKPDHVAVPDATARWIGAGNGFAAHPALAARLQLACVLEEVRASARAIGELALPRLAAGEGVAAEHALPLYVRHRVALTTAERAAGLRL
ncbi:MAG TPA: tRNA (adenosine(37)-N6)-threonylcarbamoyltransferase complex dimerization subunit type 1 TsaB [Casimicrobiaceae bacterium]|nr:tRNA (adenosine(37)-N6)-threonylcarbamoyltransferase complex dimerization subunit type 1 TsaB [Casimicrobiaceae bacterium]